MHMRLAILLHSGSHCTVLRGGRSRRTSARHSLRLMRRDNNCAHETKKEQVVASNLSRTAAAASRNRERRRDAAVMAGPVFPTGATNHLSRNSAALDVRNAALRSDDRICATNAAPAFHSAVIIIMIHRWAFCTASSSHEPSGETSAHSGFVFTRRRCGDSVDAHVRFD